MDYQADLDKIRQESKARLIDNKQALARRQADRLAKQAAEDAELEAEMRQALARFK